MGDLSNYSVAAVTLGGIARGKIMGRVSPSAQLVLVR